MENNQYIPPQNLESQNYLYEICKWTKQQKMVINQKKIKSIFNYTKNYQFFTRLAIEGEVLDTETEAKLLGNPVSNDLKWDKNTQNIIKKANKRMTC